MSMLVDLAGAAAAAGTPVLAATNGNGDTAAAEGARIKVTYSYFAVSARSLCPPFVPPLFRALLPPHPRAR